MPPKRLIIGYSFFFCLLGFITFVYGWQQLVSSVVSIGAYSIIGFIIHKGWKKIRRGSPYSFMEFFSIFLYKAAFYISLMILFLGGFILYQNFLSPAMMPQYRITNGNQTIIFQAMSHIASSEFYDKVRRDIIGAKQNNYVLYYEGVLPGSEKSSQEFDKALGIKFDAQTYNSFSKLYGVEAQDNLLFLGHINNKDYNIDLSLDRVMSLYRNKISQQADTRKQSTSTETIYNASNDLIETLSKLGERELLVLRYINQSILNFMIKHESLRNIIIEKIGNKDIFSVILDDRNSHLAREIQARDDKKIFITYGLMHFNGVLELLQKQDPNWEIVDTNYFPVIHQGR